MFKRKKKTINLVIEDYVIRIIEANSQLESAKVLVEKPIPAGIIENGKINDEIQFYGFIKDIVKEHSLKNRLVRFYVPNSLVIMRQVEFPKHLKTKEEILDYFDLELGKSIHLPFKEPVYDLYYLPEEAEGNELEMTQLQEMKEAVLFAAPREEMQRYTEILVDASLKPVLADVNALGIYRYFQEVYEVTLERIYLFVELNLTSINLSIFSANQLEFLRYQDFDIRLDGWKVDEEKSTIDWRYVEDDVVVKGVVSDQVIEIGRIMNFYRFSMHQGDKQVTDIVILGDNPYKAAFYEGLKGEFNLQIKLLENFQAKTGEIKSAFIPALGLAIEGGSGQ